MEQILVVKSSKKDVLVKNVGVGPTLYQTPQGAPSFMDLVNAARGKGTQGGKLGMGGRLAGIAGLAGKGLAGLQTVNQVAHQAQAGNPLGAALGAGYTYEANDPTGMRTATAIQGSAPGPTGPPPPPTPQHVNVGVGSYDANQIKPFNPFPGPQNVAPAPATTTRTGPPPALATPAPATPAPVAVGPTGSAARAREEFNQQFPTPSLVPQQPIPPMQQFPSTPVTSATPAPVQQSMVQQTSTPIQGPGGQAQAQALIEQQKHEDELMGTTEQKAQFFASTLMEKLGADTIYKMSPHQIAALSAYTFLKLS